MKRLILPTIIAGAVIAVPTGTVLAHNFNHVVRCEGLAWSAVDYSNPSSIVVTIDGAVIRNHTNFGTEQGSRAWAQTVSHTWRIVVDGPGSAFDRNVSGVQPACSTPTTTSPTSTTTSTPTTTTPPPIDTSGPTTTTSSQSTTTSITVEVAEPPIPPTTRAPAFDSDCVGPDWVIRNRSTVAFTVTTPGGPVALAAGVTYVVPNDYGAVTVAGVVFVRPGCTTVAVGEPPVPTTAPVEPPTPGLPVTGTDIDPAWVVLLLAAGGYLWILARRPAS